MSKRFFVILIILAVVTIISICFVNSYRSKLIKIQKENEQYEEYYNIEILGTELISIINKTVDINEKNDIQKNEQGHYIDNEKNSISIYIDFAYKEDVMTLSMEDIYSSGTEAFIKRYSTASFKCTNISYHEKTKLVKSLTFEEI